MRKLSYLSEPNNKEGEWVISNDEGKSVEFSFRTYEEAQDKFYELLSEEMR